MPLTKRCPRCGTEYDLDPSLTYCNQCQLEGLEVVMVEGPLTRRAADAASRRKPPRPWILLVPWLTVGYLYSVDLHRLAPIPMHVLTACIIVVTGVWMARWLKQASPDSGRDEVEEPPESS